MQAWFRAAKPGGRDWRRRALRPDEAGSDRVLRLKRGRVVGLAEMLEIA